MKLLCVFSATLIKTNVEYVKAENPLDFPLMKAKIKKDKKFFLLM